MKRILSFLVFLFFLFSVNAEIIDWKGSEFGIDPSPEWLTQYLNTGKDSVLRKKFDIDKRTPVIIGVGKSYEFEIAKMSSQVDATKCFEEKFSKNKKTSLVFVYEYWEEDEENFYVYSVYKVLKK